MSTDRELLEDAAKAAGWSYWDDLAGNGYLNVYDKTGRHDVFNPLDDDGDALRLMVKLGIDVIQTNIHSPQVHALADAGVRVWEDSSADPLAATRRAIVRAAAELGRSMK